MRALLAALLALTVLVPVDAAAVAAAPAGTVRDGLSQPMYSYADAIRETVWVPTGYDVDGDGAIDRVAADIIRPREAAAQHRPVPVIMDVSPYYACCGRGNERQVKTYTGTGQPVQFPLFYDNYFVPRGYAVVLVDEAGTNRSSGCFAGADNTASATAVIDWLNGRRAGFTSLRGATPARAGWSTGAVGMIGKSNDGALAIDAAATGVAGLRTIVPIAGVARYYDVFNSAGAFFGTGPQDGNPPGLLNARAARLCRPVMQAEDRAAGTSGDFNAYWRGIDSLRHVDRFRASVFAVQGFGDLNVDPIQFGKFWRALAAQGVERKAWLHQAGHVDPFDLRRALWVRTIHRWFDHYLLGVDNGIEDEPRVDLETTPDHWTRLGDWPSAAGTQTIHAGLGAAVVHDNLRRDRFQWAADPGTPQRYRTVLRTIPLPQPLRISGTPSITMTVRSSLPVARLGAEIVDYGPAVVRDDLGPGAGIRTLTTRSCYGESAPGDSACFLDTVTATTRTNVDVLAAGWADLGHYASLTHRRALNPQRYYSITFDLSTLDHTVPAGHRLGIVLGGTDAWQFYGVSGQPTLTLDLARTTLRLPTAHT